MPLRRSGKRRMPISDEELASARDADGGSAVAGWRGIRRERWQASEDPRRGREQTGQAPGPARAQPQRRGGGLWSRI